MHIDIACDLGDRPMAIDDEGYRLFLVLLGEAATCRTHSFVSRLIRAANPCVHQTGNGPVQARQPGSGGTATVDPAADADLSSAQDDLATAKAASRATPSHLPLGQVRPGSRLLETERKLLTHAIRMSAYNAESALARLRRPHYARGDDEARALLREAFTLTGDLQIIGGTLHVRLDPASAPRRSRALAALCVELTDTQTRYPGTNLTIAYSVKNHTG